MFKREIITVPAAGTFEPIDRRGRAVVVESMPGYAGPDTRPGLYFDSKSNDRQPLYNQWTYGYNKRFDKLWIEGTAESAGDEIYLLLSDSCANDQINPNTDQLQKAIAGQTFAKDSTDAAQGLSDLELTRDGKLPRSIYISARGNQINYGFVDGGSSPDQNENWHTLNVDDPPIEIQGIDFIQKFEFCSAAAGTAGTLVVSPEY